MLQEVRVPVRIQLAGFDRLHPGTTSFRARAQVREQGKSRRLNLLSVRDCACKLSFVVLSETEFYKHTLLCKVCSKIYKINGSQL